MKVIFVYFVAELTLFFKSFTCRILWDFCLQSDKKSYFLSTKDMFATRISERQESVFRVYGWCLTCVPLVLIGGANVLLPEHNVAFTLAQQCPSLGTLQNRKVATFNFIKLKQQPLLICRSVRLRFYSSPFTFSSGMPINTGVLRVKGKVQPFTALHLFLDLAVSGSAFIPCIIEKSSNS